MLANVPKASTARGTIFRDVPPWHAKDSEYWAQEKLNGVYVVWDGETLRSKTGRRIDAPAGFTDLLPPAFALVGELFVGYGHAPFEQAKTMSRNSLPKDMGRRVWRHTRLVAFDAPGLGNTTPYATRYKILRLVAGTWNKAQLAATPAALPLQVIRQYRLSKAEELFQEVVNGVPWGERKLLPFGVPALAETTIKYNALGPNIRVWTMSKADWVPEGETRMFGPSVNDTVCTGEGLMLWRQTGRWSPRGAGAKVTLDILKFKPTVIATALVVKEPYTAHMRVDGGPAEDDGDEGEDADRLGPRVKLQFWDPVQGRWDVLTAHVSGLQDMRQTLARFRLGQRVFFTFVMYDNHPRYMHAIGPRLTYCLCQALQEAAKVSNMDVPSVEGLQEAALWEAGTVRSLFPAYTKWSPLDFMRNGLADRRIAASPLIVPTPGWEPTGRSTVRELMVAANRDAKEARRRQHDQLRSHFLSQHRAMFEQVRPFLVHFFVFSALYTAACTGRTGRSTSWWTGEKMHSGVRPLRSWGPFSVARTPPGSPAVWTEALLCVLLSAMASTWARIGCTFVREHLAAASSPAEAWGTIELLLERVRDLVDHELRPLWGHPSVRDKVAPPGHLPDLFTIERKNGVLDLTKVAQFVLRQVFPQGQAPPWPLLLEPWGLQHPGDKKARLEVALDPMACLDAWKGQDQENAAYMTFHEMHLAKGWKPAVDVVRLDPSTFLPLTSEPVQVAATGPALPVDPFQASRAVAERLFLVA